MFRIAGIGLERAPTPIPVAGEPTAVALRGAVVELYDALAPAQRAAFPQLPALAERLERAALDARVPVRAEADDTRTGTEIVALETLRLELLRLHATASTPAELARELSAAMRLGNQIAKRARGPLEPTPH